MDKFWMVHADGHGAPACKHTSYESAETESKRLAAKLNIPVHILETVATVRKIEPEIKFSIDKA